MSHEFQTGPPCFPDFSERSLGRAGSNPSSSDLDNGLCLEGCMYTSNPLYHLAEMFSMQLITYWECAAARAGSPSRRNLDSIPAREEILGCSPAPAGEPPGPGLPAVYGLRRLAYSHSGTAARCVGHRSRQPLAARFHPCPKVQSKLDAAITAPTGDYDASWGWC